MHLCYFVYRWSYEQHGEDAECRHRHRIGVVQLVYNKENINMVQHTSFTFNFSQNSPYHWPLVYHRPFLSHLQGLTNQNNTGIK